MLVKRRTGWIGVDLGTHAVKIAQVERRGGRIRLRDAVAVPRQAPWSGDDLQAAPPLPSADDVRGGLLLGNNFSGRRAACLMTMQLCQTHSLNVPAGSPRERRRLIAEELDKMTDGAMADCEFDFWDSSLAVDQTEQNTGVTALSVPRNWATRAGGDVFRAGLRCGVMDAVPFAVSRAVAMVAGRDEPVAALDWGYRSLTFCLVYRGSPAYVRTIRGAGLEELVEPLRDSLNISSDEAVAVLAKHGLPLVDEIDVSEIQMAIGKIVAEKLERLVDELNRTLAFLRAQRKPLLPRRLWLFGGGATVRNVAKFLTQKIDLPVAVWDFPGAAGANRTDRGAVQKTHCPLAMFGPAMALSSLAWVNS